MAGVRLVNTDAPVQKEGLEWLACISTSGVTL